MAKIKIEIDTNSFNPIINQPAGHHQTGSPITQGIGIVSSIVYDTPMTTSFNAGLAPLIPTQTPPPPSGQIYIPTPLDKLTYKTAAIEAAIQQFNSDSNVGLIVTFGGLVTWNVANQFATKPFISLIGDLMPNNPTPPSGKFIGAVTLGSLGADLAHINDLVNVKPKVTPPEIWLLYDPRTLMAPTEVNNWTGGRAVPATNGINNPANFGADFANFKAVVISAAPYFIQHREELIAAANNTNLYLCYPLLRYQEQRW